MTSLIIDAETGSGKSAYPAALPTFNSTPQACGLSFPSWRDGQYEALSWIHERVGSGGVITLAQTKTLQDAYGESFQFDVLKGKSNPEYPCLHSKALPSATAGDCRHSKNMYDCKWAKSCAYIIQKNLCKQSSKVSMNYSLYLALKSHWPAPHALFLDECQQLPNIVLSHAGLRVTMTDWMGWNQKAKGWAVPFIPPFPVIELSSGRSLNQSSGIERAKKWLYAARTALRAHWKYLAQYAQSKKDLQLKRQVEYKGRKLTATIEALESCPSDWWIRSGPGADNNKAGFICRPLTAKHHAPGYFGFNTEANRILMSATIGDMATFAGRLGITDYQGHVVEGVWSPETRPILDLGCPPMGTASVRKNPQYIGMQSQAIADLLKEHPRDLGLIHVASKAKAWRMRQSLANLGLGGRAWVTPEVGTSEQMNAWQQERARRNNLITVAWAWWEGVDLGNVGVNIVGSIPWANIGDPYEYAKMEFDRGGFDQDAAWRVMQATGRNRRGEEEHYKLNGNRGNVVAIADGNWSRLRKHYSAAWLESVV